MLRAATPSGAHCGSFRPAPPGRPVRLCARNRAPGAVSSAVATDGGRGGRWRHPQRQRTNSTRGCLPHANQPHIVQRGETAAARRPGRGVVAVVRAVQAAAPRSRRVLLSADHLSGLPHGAFPSAGLCAQFRGRLHRLPGLAIQGDGDIQPAGLPGGAEPQASDRAHGDRDSRHRRPSHGPGDPRQFHHGHPRYPDARRARRCVEGAQSDPRGRRVAARRRDGPTRGLAAEALSMYFVVSIAVIVTMGLALVRALLGPTLYDRVLAVNMFGTKTVLLTAVIAFLYDRPDFLELALDIASWVLMSVGGLFVFIGGLGVLRMPDLFTRMHAASVTDSMGPPLILAGIMLQSGLSLATFKLVAILVFLMLTSPTASNALASAALLAGTKTLDEAGDDAEAEDAS